jgi:hypothetical protein
MKQRFPHILRLLPVLALAASATSCLKNDFDYPYVNGVIEEMTVEGQTGNTQIDETARTVSITLPDGYDIDSLAITRLVLSDGASLEVDSSYCVDPLKFPFEGFRSTADLPRAANTCMKFSKPVRFTLQTYQTYRWTVTVSQTLTRTIEVENQVGEPVIDAKTRKAVVYVSAAQRLNNVTIKAFTPEGTNTTITPDPSTVTDFTRPRTFQVKKTYANGKVKDMGTWTLDVQQTESLGETQLTEIWARKALMTGTIPQNATLAISYKRSDAREWTALADDAVTRPSATSFSATLTGLTDGTTYDWRTVVNGQEAAEGTFTTETIVEVPNLNFDFWTRDSEGDRWYPNATAADSYWATGNSGLSIAGKDNVTVPTYDAVSGRAAKLTSITDVILVGAAAGNLFIGSYKTNTSQPAASVTFGRPFTGARPTGLRGYYKYSPAKINWPTKITSTTKPQTPLGTDQAHIYVKLWDAKGNEIAYGELTESNTVAEYTPFQLGIVYTDRTAAPAQITIVVTSSKYGGEFNGLKVCGQVGDGSTLYVDEFELTYD